MSDHAVRVMLTIAIWVTFVFSLLTLMLHTMPKGNEAAMTELMTTVGSTVALVMNYWFKR